MDNPQNPNQPEVATMPSVAIPAQKNICPQCHQPVLPEYYFCPNCGKKLEEVPLSTTIWAQLWLYIFTLIVMPFTGYLAYRHWQGVAYMRSRDPKARRIGFISVILLISTIVLLTWSIWAGITQLKESIQTQQNNINSLGGFY